MYIYIIHGVCFQGEGEKLCDEVFQMRQSLTDAETVTRDAQREAAFLRSKNLELKEQMVSAKVYGCTNSEICLTLVEKVSYLIFIPLTGC